MAEFEDVTEFVSFSCIESFAAERAFIAFFYCADVCIDENSSWVVTADSRIRSLQCTGAVTDAQGQNATILGSDGTVYLQGAGSVTVTVDTYGDGCDLSGAGESTGWEAYSDP